VLLFYLVCNLLKCLLFLFILEILKYSIAFSLKSLKTVCVVYKINVFVNIIILNKGCALTKMLTFCFQVQELQFESLSALYSFR